jgi:hypothetical protein
VIVGLYRDCAGLAGVSRIGKIHRRKPVCKVSHYVYRRCADKLRASSAGDGQSRCRLSTATTAERQHENQPGQTHKLTSAKSTFRHASQSRSRGEIAAIDIKLRTRNIRRFIRGEEQDGIRHLIDFTGTPQGHPF